jgi:hypothetical protein
VHDVNTTNAELQHFLFVGALLMEVEQASETQHFT